MIRVTFLLSGFIVLVGTALGQARPVQVSLVELIAAPEKLDAQVVTVRGYLQFQRERGHITDALLFLHQEDAKHVLANSIPVMLNEQMRKDWEKLDHMYVVITGTVRTAKVSGHDTLKTAVIEEVRSCDRWSDPNHPLGVRADKRARE